VDLRPAKGDQLLAHQRVPIVTQLPPSRIAELGGALSRSDDVGEHHGRQHPRWLAALPLASDELFDMVSDEVLRLDVENRVVLPGTSTNFAAGMCSAR